MGPQRVTDTARISFAAHGLKICETLRWREMDSNFRYRGTKAVDFRSILGIAGRRRAPNRHHVMVQPITNA